MDHAESRGILAQSDGPLFGGKVFFLDRGRRHWVGSAEWIAARGFAYPGDVNKVSDELLLAFLPGQFAPALMDELPEVIETFQVAREASAFGLKGIGLEVGAGGNPFPVPLECQVVYGDMYSREDLLKNRYGEQKIYDIVDPAVRTNLDTLENVADGSLDFLVACHVIEHTKNPIGAITKAYSKLRMGGSLVLVIPDKERTFDKARPVTAIDHMVDDFSRSHPDRDMEHYREFFSLAEGFQVPPETLEDHWRTKWKEDYSIHFHTWTYESFGEMISWVRQNSAPYRDLWSLSCRPDGIEFYYRLTK